ncbi:hypothetical protein L596_009210 [Steinernema carpocapsae]|uniref:Cyclin N-terminal domain-containing protein n=1 Tax=Steinernema carpocapsae TaxID=34508 RepID=A0A4V6A6L0_STECR|nr:hypothetical protein L596_009210 [Steinernema carpocapsae]
MLRRLTVRNDNVSGQQSGAMKRSAKGEEQLPAKRSKLARVPIDGFGYEEFVDDMFNYSLHLERQEMTLQAGWLEVLGIEPKMREVLLDWMIQVHARFQLLPETLDLTVHILNVAIRRLDITKNNLQLAGIASMFIAAKYEETYPPTLEDYVSIVANCFSKDEIRSMEIQILKCTGCCLSVPYLINFVRRGSTVIMKQRPSNARSIHNMAKFFSEVALVDSSLAHMLPSLNAATSIYVALKLEGYTWNEELATEMGYQEDELRDIARMFVKPITTWTNPYGRLQGLRDKYSGGSTAHASILSPEQKDLLQELAM